MRFVAVITIIFLSACGGDSRSDDIKIRQAFNIYNEGNYSFVEPCPKSGLLDNTITIGKNSVRMGHAVCDIKTLKSSKKPTGFKISLANCRSDSGNEKPAIIIIEPLKEGKALLHGWGDKPVPIYTCPNTKT